MRPVVLLMAVIALSACGLSESGLPNRRIDGAVGDTITLAVGQSATVAGVVVSFVGVPSDSRCPVDVVCVAAGNAVAELIVGPGAGLGPAYRVTLNTTEGPREADALGVRILLLALRPDPVSSLEIEPEDYVLDIRVDIQGTSGP